MAGVLLVGLSLLSFLYALILKFIKHVSLISTPLLLLTAIAFITGSLCILLGLLAEILIRVYFETQHKVTYTIRSSFNLEDQP
jgi:dolichol-phosphate mannosyltransferase